MEALILVATLGGPTMFARIGIMRALNRNVERAFDSARKDPHWGRRSATVPASTAAACARSAAVVSWLGPGANVNRRRSGLQTSRWQRAGNTRRARSFGLLSRYGDPGMITGWPSA
jgi:hypothetical protein